MKNLTFGLIVLSGFAFASEYEYLDEYGNIEHTISEESDESFVVKDKYGNRSYTIDQEGTIKDKYGAIQGSIKKTD